MAALKTIPPENTPVIPTEMQGTLPRQSRHPLDKVIGIFQDEPLMDALMDRVRGDRRTEAEAETAE